MKIETFGHFQKLPHANPDKYVQVIQVSHWVNNKLILCIAVCQELVSYVPEIIYSIELNCNVKKVSH